MSYRLVGSAIPGFKSISLGDFDTWLDAQMQGKGDTAGAYAAVSWAFRCVNLRANAVATMPFTVTRVGGEDEVDTPWPLQRLLWNSEAALCTWGAFYWLKRANQVLIKELQWLNPLTMTVKRDANGVTGFTQKTGATERFFPPEQIVYGRLWNPTDDLGPGVAPLQVALEACGIAQNINAWAATFFAQGAIPALLLHTDSTLPRGEAERIEGKWAKATSGIRNAWKAIVLQGGLKPEVITPPVNTLALPELRAGARGEIATAMGIPQTLLEDAANFATAQEHKRSFILDTVVPECELIAETVNEQLFAPLGLELTFNPQEMDILQADEAARAVSLGQLVTAGLPLKLALEVLGFDLSEEQWAQLEAVEADKKANADRQFELQKEKLDRPVQVMPPFGGPPALPEPDKGAKDEPPMRGDKKALAEEVPDAHALVILADLRNWRRKCTKRGELADWVSEVIPAHVASAVKALGVDGWERGFEWLTRYDGLKARREPDRVYEEKLRRIIQKVLAAQLDEASDNIVNGLPVDYEAMANELKRAMLPALTNAAIDEAVAQAATVGISFDIVAINTAALEWATKYSFELIKDLTETTRNLVSKGVTAFIETPGMTVGELRGLLERGFSPARASMIATTEVTRAYTQGTQITQAELREAGVNMERVWNTSGDERVCEICSPLNNKPESEWGGDELPGHGGCRCFDTLRTMK
jgi:HK97 family phage portal protein